MMLIALAFKAIPPLVELRALLRVSAPLEVRLRSVFAVNPVMA